MTTSDKHLASIAATLTVLSHVDKMLGDAILSGLATDHLADAIGLVRQAREKIKADAAKEGIYL